MSLVKLFRNKDRYYCFDAGSFQLFEIDTAEAMIFNEITKNKISIKGEVSTNQLNLARSRIEQERESNLLSSSLFDMVFDLNKETIKIKLDGNLSSFTLSIINGCNAQCHYCVFGPHYYRHKSFDNICMDRDTINATIKFIIHSSRNKEKLRVTFYGGEALLKLNQIQYIVSEFKRLIPNKIITYAVNTNGLLLGDVRIVEYLVEHNFALHISLDGPKYVHDRYRRDINNIETFDRITQNLSTIRSRFPDYYQNKVLFNCVIAPPYDALNDIIPFFKNDKVTKNTIYILSLVDTDSTTFLDCFGDRETHTNKFFATLEHSRNALFELGKKMKLGPDDFDHSLYYRMYETFFKRILKLTLSKPQISNGKTKLYPLAACYPLFRRVHISERGELYVCEKDGEGKPLGSVFDGVDYKAVLKLLQDFNTFLEDCKSCWAAPFCMVCHVHLYKPTHNNQNKIKVCEKFKLTAEKHLIEYTNFEEHKVFSDMLKAFRNDLFKQIID